MKLNQSLFWDTDIDKVDLKENARFIITRTFMRGTFQEFKTVIDFYGKEFCKDELVQARYLDKKTLAFCCTIFKLSKEDFRCYKLSQSTPQHWNY